LKLVLTSRSFIATGRKGRWNEEKRHVEGKGEEREGRVEREKDDSRNMRGRGGMVRPTMGAGEGDGIIRPTTEGKKGYFV
jgi:hypothetical protein